MAGSSGGAASAAAEVSLDWNPQCIVSTDTAAPRIFDLRARRNGRTTLRDLGAAAIDRNSSPRRSDRAAGGELDFGGRSRRLGLRLRIRQLGHVLLTERSASTQPSLVDCARCVHID